MHFRWSIVHIITSGLNIRQDKILEISILVFAESGIIQKWHRKIRVPKAVQLRSNLVIEDGNVKPEKKVSFAKIVPELTSILAGTILVAHNARFVFTFLKNAFKKLNMPFSMPLLCTIRLFRKIYPDYACTNLTQFFIQSGVEMAVNATETEILYHAIQKIIQEQGLEKTLVFAKQCYKKASIPSRLKTDMDAIPDSPGVYLFYGSKTSLPLYIGKSIALRQRILSHFQSDHGNPKEFALSQQVERVEFVPTAGELSALLLESQLVKTKMPLYNQKLRQKITVVGFKTLEKDNYLQLTLSKETCFEGAETLTGAWRSMNAAKNGLLRLVKAYRLCAKLCGLEQGKSACFGWHLKTCSGACIKEEPFEAYNARVASALTTIRQEHWPFKGAIAIKETCLVNQITQYMVFNQWRYLGCVTRDYELSTFKGEEKRHDLDDYRILSGFLRNTLQKDQLILLG